MIATTINQVKQPFKRSSRGNQSPCCVDTHPLPEPLLLFLLHQYHGTHLDVLCKVGVVYTMDHEVVPRPCKISNWLLNSSWHHFSLHQGKNVRVTMKFEVPKRHILRRALSTNIVHWVLWRGRQKRCFGRKRQGPMVGKYCFDRFWM